MKIIQEILYLNFENDGYSLDGQVCLKFGVVDPLFTHKMVDDTNFLVCIKFPLIVSSDEGHHFVAFS